MILVVMKQTQTSGGYMFSVDLKMEINMIVLAK